MSVSLSKFCTRGICALSGAGIKPRDKDDASDFAEKDESD